MPLLQLLRHAPVHPEETHAIPHGRATLPLRDLREEVHAPGAHEAAHLGKEAPGGGVLAGTGGGLLRLKIRGASSHLGFVFCFPLWGSSEPLKTSLVSFLPTFQRPSVLLTVHPELTNSCPPNSARGVPEEQPEVVCTSRLVLLARR